MSSTKIKYNPKNQNLTIDDEAKSVHYIFLVFSITQLCTNSIQVYSRWGQFDTNLFYVFCLLVLAFTAFTIYYLFYDSYTKELRLDDIVFYKEKAFFWTKLRYFKLKNNRIRLINLKSRSQASKDLKSLLNKNQILIKS